MKKYSGRGNAVCPQCGRTYRPALKGRPGFWTSFTEWSHGKLIQDAFPSATDEEREQLMTGVCSSACFAAMMAPCEEEEDDDDALSDDERAF